MLLSNEPLDLIGGEIDVALRLGNLPDSNLVARRLGVLRTQVYASKNYLARYGEPLGPDDLQHHRALAMPKHRRGGGSFCWTLNDGNQDKDFAINPILVANDPAALKGALLCGEGLMVAADVMVKPYLEQGYVQRVLAGWTGPEFEFNAVFPRGRMMSPKVRAFVDFLVERLKFDMDYMMEHCPVYLKQQAEACASALAESARRETEAEEAVEIATGRRVLAEVVE